MLQSLFFSLGIIFILGFNQAKGQIKEQQYGLDCVENFNGYKLEDVILKSAQDSIDFLKWVDTARRELCYYCYDNNGELNEERVFSENYVLLYEYFGILSLKDLDTALVRNRYLNKQDALTDWEIKYFGKARSIIKAELIGRVIPVKFYRPGSYNLHFHYLLLFRVKEVLMNKDGNSLSEGDTVIKADWSMIPEGYYIRDSDTLFRVGYSSGMPIYQSNKDYILFLAYPAYAHLVKSYKGDFEDRLCFNYCMPMNMGQIYEYEQNIEKISVFKYLFSNN